jgi:hypothetical protein
VIYVKVKGIKLTIVATFLFKAEFFYAHRIGENLPAVQQKDAISYSHLMTENNKDNSNRSPT